MKYRKTSQQKIFIRLSFTLVELLIVISILAILISLLSPSLRKAFDTAHTITCTNNQKNIVQIVMRYSEDFNGYMHAENRPKLATDPTGAEFYFMNMMQAYDANIPVAQWYNWSNGAGTNAYSGPWNQNFICPADVNPSHKVKINNTPSAYGRKSISYGVNQGVWYRNPNAPDSINLPLTGLNYALHLPSLSRPSERALGVDNSLGFSLNNAMRFAVLPTGVRLNRLSYTARVDNDVDPSGFKDLGEIEWDTNPTLQKGSLMLRHQNLFGYNAFFLDGHVNTYVFPDYPESFILDKNVR